MASYMSLLTNQLAALTGLGSNQDPTDDRSSWRRQEATIALVAFYLTRLLHDQSVPHIIDQILDDGEHWICLKTRRHEAHNNALSVRAFGARVACSAEPFLELLPMNGFAQNETAEIVETNAEDTAPSTHISRRKFRRLAVEITGKSQDYCSFPEQGSWSWYGIAKRQRGNAEFEHGPALVHNDFRQRRYTLDLAKTFAETHEVHVDADDEGELAAWCRQLHEADSVAIFPKAQFPGWVNFTKAANIELFFTADIG